MVQLFRSGRCSCVSSRTMDCDELTVCTLTESPLEGALEKLSLGQPAGRRVSPHRLLTLPMEVLDGIFRQTDSHDALALSGTCTRLRPLATWAYSDIRFALGRPERPKVLSATVEALQLLTGALRSRPDHAMAVRSIVLCDPIPANLQAVNSANVPWPTWNLLAEQLDFNIAELLSLTPMLRRFIWSNYAVGHYTDIQQTMTQLKRLQCLQEVSLYRARAEIPDVDLDSRTHSIRPERLSVDCLKSSPWWCSPFLRNNNRLRSLDLRFVGDPQDTDWARELYLAAISWRKLETLNVECSEEGARAMLGLIAHCAACESWPSLASISFKPMFSHNRSILPEFLTTLRSFPIRRLHLTVNEFVQSL
ncbi:hypothetical protein PHLGIDRAFT_16474 [Phlebiopsis gigantea 11061_1 CR5-6]|uniref:F-box domain-containing protein n=1 Tax=Phlebiopsis gigantea (strain 11061_1 CR5-6) TaxID=745531 RepID=A0A0C3S3Q0_PHLG1|nr:hypothetical protein PHLGIDRAFT_16474 [Phlebiopsis gigantea 11061_1 CR5-6]